jgi:hypothetical protein
VDFQASGDSFAIDSLERYTTTVQAPISTQWALTRKLPASASHARDAPTRLRGIMLLAEIFLLSPCPRGDVVSVVRARSWGYDDAGYKDGAARRRNEWI